jgi:hypothetical protein
VHVLLQPGAALTKVVCLDAPAQQQRQQQQGSQQYELNDQNDSVTSNSRGTSNSNYHTPIS